MNFKKINKVTPVVMCFALFFVLLFGVIYFFNNARSNDPANKTKLSILAAEFTEYDFAQQIVKDKAEVTMLLPPGIEGHEYEATALDVLNVSKSDIFLFSGTKVEPWVSKIINKSVGSNSNNVVDVSNNVDFIKTGNNAKDVDPHIYLDLKNAEIVLANILNAICIKDPSNSEFYRKNAEEYKRKIIDLDAEFKNLADNSKLKKIVFATRFAGAYFTGKYSLSYISAYQGCDSSSEPDAKKISELISFVKENNIPVIFYEEPKDLKLAQVISKETGAKILKFNTIHSVDKSQIENKTTYLDLMHENLNNLRQALI